MQHADIQQEEAVLGLQQWAESGRGREGEGSYGWLDVVSRARVRCILKKHLKGWFLKTPGTSAHTEVLVAPRPPVKVATFNGSLESRAQRGTPSVAQTRAGSRKRGEEWGCGVCARVCVARSMCARDPHSEHILQTQPRPTPPNTARIEVDATLCAPLPTRWQSGCGCWAGAHWGTPVVHWSGSAQAKEVPCLRVRVIEWGR